MRLIYRDNETIIFGYVHTNPYTGIQQRKEVRYKLVRFAKDNMQWIKE